MRKNLCGFQLSVFADEQNPSHVLESYDFTFQYNEHAKIRNPQLVGVAIPGIDGKPVTITSARAGVEAIIHHLYGMEAFLPDLSSWSSNPKCLMTRSDDAWFLSTPVFKVPPLPQIRRFAYVPTIRISPM